MFLTMLPRLIGTPPTAPPACSGVRAGGAPPHRPQGFPLGLIAFYTLSGIFLATLQMRSTQLDFSVANAY